MQTGRVGYAQRDSARRQFDHRDAVDWRIGRGMMAGLDLWRIALGYRLPPLTTLRLFESAGRLLSFKAAAEDLNVTPSAVSHGIQTLEDWLGVKLFERGTRSLSLTPSGGAFLPQVQAVLEQLARAVESVPGRRPTGRLCISAAPTFAQRWLVPRLDRFHELQPDIEVVIDTSPKYVSFPRDGVDLAIRRGKGPWEGLFCHKLVEESLVPVCAPAPAGTIASVADLEKAVLLKVVAATEDWSLWQASTGHCFTPGRSLSFDTIQMATDSAIRGMGVALGRLPLIDGDLAEGTLVPVLGPPVKCVAAYWLVGAPESFARPEVAAFRDWVMAAA
jgi:DNA-binding transcriptional LysR family regulator